MFVARPIVAPADQDDSAHVPEWVPEVVEGVRADVYPVLDGRVELRLDRAAVTGGYAERKQSYEFASCITGNPEMLRSSAVPAPMLGDPAQLGRMLAKVRQSLALLRRSRPSKLQRVELGTVPRILPDEDDKKRVLFPFQKPSANASLDDWFNRLSSGGAFSTATLAAAVPLGPAIVRAAGKVLEMMASRGVPTQRAAWYIRIAVLNECVKQVRPGRPAPKPRNFWTRQLCTLLKLELDTIRARRAASLGTMDRIAFWNYVLDLAKWQADENLLDEKVWLTRICTQLKAEVSASPALNSTGGKIIIATIQRFLPQCFADPDIRQSLYSNLLHHAAYVLGVAHASCAPANGRRSSSRASQQIQPLTSTNSQPAYNKAIVDLAALLGDSSPDEAALRRVLAKIPKKFAHNEAMDAAFELVSSNSQTKEWPPLEKSPKNRNDKLWDSLPVTLSPLDFTAALERFPAAGNAHVLRIMMHGAFATRGGDRAAVEHVCKWALSAKSFFTSHVVATAASAIEILTQAANQRTALNRKSSAKSTPNAKDSKTANTQQQPLPVYHREIWLFLKEIAEDEDRFKDFGTDEESEEDSRVAALIARLCRVGVFSLTAFVRDVARIPSNPPLGCGRLVRYVQLLPEPHERTAADARRSLLRRHGLLPSAAQLTRCTDALEHILELVRSGDEARCITEAAKLRADGEPGMLLTIAASVVDDVTESLYKNPESVVRSLSAVVAFFRASGTSALAADVLLTTLSHLLGLTAQNGARTQILCSGICIAIDCLPQLAPVLAATNQLTTTMSLLVRVWNVPMSNTAQQKIRASADTTALMIGKYFCSCAPTEHEHWKQMVLGSLSSGSFGPLKSIFCGLMAGVQPIVMEKQQALASVHTFLSKSTQIVRNGILGSSWMGQGIEKINDPTERNLRKALLEKKSQVDVQRYYKELRTVNHVIDGVFIPVLRISQKIVQLATDNDKYCNVVDNVANILASTWMCALADEIRPYSFVEVIALLLWGAMANYNGAREALAKIVTLPWVRRLFALHAGRPTFERLRRIVRENLPADVLDDATVTSEVCATAFALSGAGEQIEARSVVAAVTVRPVGVTQMLFCNMLALAASDGTQDFATRAADVVVACASSSETTVLTRMLLKCYDDETQRSAAAADAARCAASAMEESARIFIAGVTAPTMDHDDVNQQRAAAWLSADEARRAVITVAAPHVTPDAAATVVTSLAHQADTLAERLTQAAEQRHIPRAASPTGIATADALAARAKLMLAFTRAAAKTADRPTISTSAARLLAAAAYLLPPNAVDALVETIAMCVGNDEKLAEQIRDAAMPARPFLGRTQWAAFARAAKLPVRPAPIHRPVEAKGPTGEQVDNWYLLEGYGRGQGEEAAVPPEAFNAQDENGTENQGQVENQIIRQSVRLKRTYSTYACLVR